MSSRGLVMVYTGDGKGKTTAALGLAMRHVGWGRRVLIIQFMKGRGRVSGEHIAATKLAPLLTIERYGRDEFVDLRHPSPEDVELAKKALRRAKEAVCSGEFKMVILDEVNVALHARLVGLGEVLDLLDSKPLEVHLVLTGRYAPKEVVELADLVSEVVAVKHHYNAGVPAQEGIEF